MARNKVIDKQFKLDAVQYRKDHPELTFQQVADNLGVSNSSIHRWCKQFDEAKIKNEDSNLFRGSGNFSSDKAKELARLKKENKDDKGIVRYDTRRVLVASLTFVQKICNIEVGEYINQKFIAISNRQASFENMKY